MQNSSFSRLPKCFLGALCASLLYALPSQLTAGHQEIDFDRFSSVEGASEGGAERALQDDRGFIWFGTRDGLDRFDGHSFRIYRHDPRDSTSISGDIIVPLLLDHSGVLWIGTDGEGLNRMDRTTGKFVAFRHDPQDLNSLCNNYVRAIIEEAPGIFWIGTWEGLDRFDAARGSFTHFMHNPQDTSSLSSSDIKSLFIDRHRTLWVGTEHGLNVFDKETRSFRSYRNDPRHPTSLTNDVRAISEDVEGFLWIATSDAGVWKFDPEQRRFSASFRNNPRDPRSLSSDKTTCLIIDDENVLWVGTIMGLNRFDKATGDFSSSKHDPKNSSSLSGNNVLGVYQDRAGSIWVGTAAGLNKFDRRQGHVSFMQNDPGNPNSLSRNFVYPICEDRSGVLWIGTWGGGLNRYDRASNRFTVFRHDSSNRWSIGADDIRAIIEDKHGTLWIGTLGGGLNSFDRNRRIFHSYRWTEDPGAPSNFIYSLLISRSGTFWVGTGWGLYTFDAATGTFTQFACRPDSTDEFIPDCIKTVFEDRAGILWIGTLGSGVYRYDPVTRRATRFRHDPRDTRSLINDRVSSFIEDQTGTLWAGTYGGLCGLSPGVNAWQRFGKPDGLPDNTIYSMIGDRSGNIWVGTAKGICRFTPRTGKFKSYGMRDGWPMMECNGESSFLTPRGEVFIGGIDGVVSFFPDSLRDNPFIPPIVLTSFKKFYQEFPLPRDISETASIELSHEDAVFSFEFAALSFVHSDRNQYAYRLDGFDRDWVYCGTAHTATYTHLDPGTYVFRVKGSNNDGLWNEQGTSIAIVIRPPFWKTWWFNALAWVMLLASGAGLVRYIEIKKLKRRITQLEKERALEQERARISRDMHDEIGSSLSEIAVLSELAKAKPDEALLRVEEIAVRAEQVIDSLGGIVWILNPRNDTLDNLIAHIRRYALKYLDAAGITCAFTTPDVIPSSHVPGEVRRNIFLVVKEALHNVVKHSGATRVALDVLLEESVLVIVIKDEGRGFRPEERVRAGNGLESMSKRMTDCGGTLEIQSEPGCGTVVRLTTGIAA